LAKCSSLIKRIKTCEKATGKEIRIRGIIAGVRAG
jgi:hypothetical protein